MAVEIASQLTESSSVIGTTWWLVFGAACLFTGAIVALLLFSILDTAVKDHMLRRKHRELQYWQGRAMRAEDPSWRQ